MQIGTCINYNRGKTQNIHFYFIDTKEHRSGMSGTEAPVSPKLPGGTS